MIRNPIEDEHIILLERIICGIESLFKLKLNEPELYNIEALIKNPACYIKDDIRQILRRIIREVSQLYLIDPTTYDEDLTCIDNVLSSKIEDDLFYLNNNIYKLLITFINKEIAKHNIKINTLHQIIVDMPNSRVYTDFLKTIAIINISGSWPEVYNFLLTKVHPTASVELKELLTDKQNKNDKQDKHERNEQDKPKSSVTFKLDNN